MKKQATKDGISHLYLCMIHYEKGPKKIEIIPTGKKYKNWDLPLNSNVPMGSKKIKPKENSKQMKGGNK